MAARPNALVKMDVLDKLTITTKLFVALNGGKPLSVTTVVMVLVLPACPSAGIQVMMPLVSIPAPTGGFSKMYVKVWTGISESAAVLVTISVASGLMV